MEKKHIAEEPEEIEERNLRGEIIDGMHPERFDGIRDNEIQDENNLQNKKNRPK